MSKKIEILGKTFNSEEEARKYYQEDLRKRLPELKKIEGFPIGEDEDILALSNPPYYTACPNPYINDFIERYGTPYNEETDDYHREPFVGDVSEGKSDVIYTAHGYHTKVPYKAIRKYIEHYSEEGDLIIDSFSGTGMTGVASQSLSRKTILSDLSPLATLISHIYNSKIEPSYYEKVSKEFLFEIETECGWMYETKHTLSSDTSEKQSNLFNEKTNIGKINYTVWSDVFVCPFCKNEYVFFKEAFNVVKKSVSTEYSCPNCQAVITKKGSARAYSPYYDEVLGQTIQQAKQVPVLINYSFNGETFTKELDDDDFKLIEKINNLKIPYWVPTDRMPEGDESRRNDKMGITHVHHYFTQRSLYTLSAVYNTIVR
jgi:transposase-like protein